MTDYKHEYQKYADDAVRGRAREEGFGRLRMSAFWGIAGTLASFLVHLLNFTPPKWMAWGIVGMAPLAVISLILNFIRLPNDQKATSTALLIGFVTLLGAAATILLARQFGITALL
jgi:hypothetical protein